MSDVDLIDLKLNGTTISGPWRLTTWTKAGKPPSYVFSEEHASKGSCPEEKDISKLLMEIINDTQNVHVFIEHYIHANDVSRQGTVESACSVSKDKAILNNLRHCLEVIRVKDSALRSRVHFVDPRTDIVAILPDGKVYDAIDSHVAQLTKDGDKEGVIMTIYEAFIHPLLSLFPDNKDMGGRMVGKIQGMKEKMTPEQVVYFEKVWKEDVIGRISKLTNTFGSMQKNSNVALVSDIKVQYRDMTNKFLDTWLLANVFLAENTMGMTASMIYLGSLHSLHFEDYLVGLGYIRKSITENKDLSACIRLS